MATLPNKRQRFVSEYLRDQNATQAAIRTGYSPKTAKSQGQRLLTNVDVAREIQLRLKKVADNADVTKERVLKALLNIAELDPLELFNTDGTMKSLKDMSESARKAIASIESDDMLASVRKVRFHPKVEALALLAKTVKGLIVSTHEVTGRGGAPLVPPALGTPIDFSKFTKADIFRIAGVESNGHNGHSG
jgi:phage terminase small subunit